MSTFCNPLAHLIIIFISYWEYSPLILPLNFFKISTPDALTRVSLPCTAVCVIPLWLMNTHDFCLSQQGSRRSAHGLRKAWRKEREEKKSFFPSHRGQTREQVVLGGSLTGMRDGHCPSRSRGRGAFEHTLVWWGGSGEEWERNLNFC